MINQTWWAVVLKISPELAKALEAGWTLSVRRYSRDVVWTNGIGKSVLHYQVTLSNFFGRSVQGLADSEDRAAKQALTALAPIMARAEKSRPAGFKSRG